MSNESKPVRIIPKEKAAFRLDKYGVWRVDDEKFAHQRIIRHFNASIRRDDDGYFLQQEHRDYIEKVYFPYEDTALFVDRVIEGDRFILCLNTGAEIPLDPRKLLIKGDHLYMHAGEDLVKFKENALLAIADYLEDADGQYAIRLDGKRYPIARLDAGP